MDIATQLLQLEKRVAALELIISSGNTPDSIVGERKALSVRELINQLKPSTANDVALVIGYYNETLKEIGYFTNDDIKLGFSQAKMIAPKNISDVMAKNTKKGYIMPDDTNSTRTKKAWVLTNTGEEYINSLSEPRD